RVAWYYDNSCLIQHFPGNLSRCPALRNTRPNEHRRLRFGDIPARLAQAFNDNIASPLIRPGHRSALWRHIFLQRCDPSPLYSHKHSVVDIRLENAERLDHIGSADHKCNAAASHIEAFRQGMELNSAVLRPFDFQNTWRSKTVKGHFRISQIM